MLMQQLGKSEDKRVFTAIPKQEKKGAPEEHRKYLPLSFVFFAGVTTETKGSTTSDLMDSTTGKSQGATTAGKIPLGGPQLFVKQKKLLEEKAHPLDIQERNQVQVDPD